MAYDALERGRDIISSGMLYNLSGYVTKVAADHGVTSPGGPRQVVTGFETRPSYPLIEISPPRGTLASLSYGEIATEADYWVIASVQGADPTWVDDACMCYLTAIIRLFASSDFSQGSTWLASPVEFDYSPPVFESDTTQKRSVGVLVRFSFAEAV